MPKPKGHREGKRGKGKEGPMELTLMVSLGWTALLAFILGTSAVACLWARSRGRRERDERELAKSVWELVKDSRDNAMLYNVALRAGKGNEAAKEDLRLLVQVVKAANALTGNTGAIPNRLRAVLGNARAWTELEQDLASTQQGGE